MPDLSLVVNTGPIIALSLVGRLAILGKIYSRVIVPQDVCTELERGADRAGSGFRANASWITVASPKSTPPAP